MLRRCRRTADLNGFSEAAQWQLAILAAEDQVSFVTASSARPIRPYRVVYTWSWKPPGMDVGVTLVTVEFHEKGDATERVLTHEKFPTAEAASQHSKGGTGCIEFFVGFVEASDRSLTHSIKFLLPRPRRGCSSACSGFPRSVRRIAP